MKNLSDVFFYDTSSLLETPEEPFNRGEEFIVSSVTLKELENIKTSSTKDEEVKYSARLVTKLISEHSDIVRIIIHKDDYLRKCFKDDYENTNDYKILADAIWCDTYDYCDRVVFVTNDIALKNIANMYFGDGMILSTKPSKDTYTGYKEIHCPSDEELAMFYSNPGYNTFANMIGEYLILFDSAGDVIDSRVWTGEIYRPLKFDDINSMQFGKIKPKDIYQRLAIDSFFNNQITYIGGKAGSGKSFLALAFLFNQLERGGIERIVIFSNPVVAKNAAKLGFYPGSMEEKLLSTQTGHILASKLGDYFEVEKLLENDKLVLVPAGDARGYQTPSHSGVYIMEAQNYDTTLLRMLLQRIDDTSIVICDGDRLEQTDLDSYSGRNNGLARMSQVFRGNDCYGQVELKTIYRSRIANLAEQMK